MPRHYVDVAAFSISPLCNVNVRCFFSFLYNKNSEVEFRY